MNGHIKAAKSFPSFSLAHWSLDYLENSNNNNGDLRAQVLAKFWQNSSQMARTRNRKEPMVSFPKQSEGLHLNGASREWCDF